MPIHEYIAQDPDRSCSHCKTGFEQLEQLEGYPLDACPECGNPVRRKISAPAVGRSESNLNDRAKSAGFHKLKKLSKGEYEKKY